MRELIRHIIHEHVDEQRKPRGYWTLDKVLEIAKKVNSMEELRRTYPNVYDTLRRNKDWKDEVWKLFKPLQITWTKELAKSFVDNYNDLTEFTKDNAKVLSAIRRNGWLDLLEPLKKDKRAWTDDEIRQEAQKYDSVSDFRKYAKNAMDAAINHGIYDEVSTHMKRVGTKWTKQMVWDEALKYQTRSEFMNGNYAAYQAAHSKGWWDDVTSHMVRLGNLHNRLVYVYEFPDNSVYVGLTMNKQDRNLRHRTKEKSAVYQHIKKTNLEPIMKVVSDDYIDAEDARNLEHCTIQKYKNDGWNVLNKAEAGGLGGRCIKMYTKEQAQQEALKYQTPTQFMEKSSSIYRQAKKNGWLPEITQHMIKKTKWTKDMIIDKMSQHKSMNDFRKNDFNSWAAAYRILGNQFIKDYYSSK
jgi:predicted GIY-YIG superfamily endonuclease